VANGFQGSREEWARLEAPLIAIDDVLAVFASQHGLSIEKNRGFPERSIRWGSPVSRLIQIFIAAEDVPTFHLWLCASEDRGRDRFWKREFLLESVTGAQLADGLGARLAGAYEVVAAWQPTDLEFAGHLRG
jgi:hypothetical protein